MCVYLFPKLTLIPSSLEFKAMKRALGEKAVEKKLPVAGLPIVGQCELVFATGARLGKRRDNEEETWCF